jgi:peptidoglycan/LPS O-acetylase OafA/YrhL
MNRPHQSSQAAQQAGIVAPGPAAISPEGWLSQSDPIPTATSSVVSSSQRLPCLDGIRAVAILMVLVSHAQPSINISVPHGMGIVWHALGGLGVNLFFGLSGYLITHLLVQEYERVGKISLRKFYLRRALRILPAFLFFMLFILAINMAGFVHITRPELRSALFFYKNYSPGDVKSDAWYVGHIWSLSMEEQFYIIWPPLLVFCGLPIARKLALVIALLMPFFRAFAYFRLNTHAPYLVGIMFHTTADKMLWGCLLAMYSGHPNFEQIMSKLRSPLAFAGSALFYIGLNPLLEEHWRAAYVFSLGISLQAITAIFCIAWVLRNLDSSIARFLNLKWIASIGVLSYSLYLWQQPFTKDPAKGLFQLFPVNIICTVIGALLSYHLVEKTALRWKKRFRV